MHLVGSLAFDNLPADNIYISRFPVMLHTPTTLPVVLTNATTLPVLLSVPVTLHIDLAFF